MFVKWSAKSYIYLETHVYIGINIKHIYTRQDMLNRKTTTTNDTRLVTWTIPCMSLSQAAKYKQTNE